MEDDYDLDPLEVMENLVRNPPKGLIKADTQTGEIKTGTVRDIDINFVVSSSYYIAQLSGCVFFFVRLDRYYTFNMTTVKHPKVRYSTRSCGKSRILFVKARPLGTYFGSVLTFSHSGQKFDRQDADLRG